MKKRMLILITLACLISGCGKDEHLRGLNWQNKGAAEVIRTVENSKLEPDAVIIQAATDIESNSGEIVELYGKPKEPRTYTPETSETLRNKSAQFRKLGFWKGVVMDVILDYLSVWLPGIGATLVGVWGWYQAFRKKKQVRGLIESGQNILKLVRDGETLSVKTAKEAMVAGQAAWNVKGDIQNLIAILRSKQEISKISGDESSSE